MHQARAATTKWAIEYWKPAADAFKLNNPDAAVHHGNCNVLLHCAMAKAGQSEQCEASEECVAESAALGADTVATLPLPGEVDFICGGPPCQVCCACWLHRFVCLDWAARPAAMGACMRTLHLAGSVAHMERIYLVSATIVGLKHHAMRPHK